jgi:carboxypeptidase family protein
MGTDILKVAGAVAGIGGIAIGTLLLIFREVIRKNIFSTLTKSDSYRLMWWILILVWSVALVGIAAYVYVEAIGIHKLLLYQGTVSDAITGHPIRGAMVVILGRQDIAPQTTDDNGNFLLRLETSSGAFQGKVRVAHPGYEIWEKPIDLTRTATDEVLLSWEKPQEFELSGEVRIQVARYPEHVSR